MCSGMVSTVSSSIRPTLTMSPDNLTPDEIYEMELVKCSLEIRQSEQNLKNIKASIEETQRTTQSLLQKLNRFEAALKQFNQAMQMPIKSEPTINDEELYQQSVQLVLAERKASPALLQRRFNISYGRAAKIIDLMEQRGIISAPVGATRTRTVLFGNQQ